MPLSRRVVPVFVVALAVGSAACSDASAPTSAPTLSLALSTHTVAAGDTVTAIVVGRQAQNFLFKATVLAQLGSQTIGQLSDSTPGGSTRISVQLAVQAPDSAVGRYVRFTAVDSAYQFPALIAVDSALITP